MAQIALNDLDDLEVEAIAAQADLEGTTVDGLFTPWVRDLVQNRAGIRADVPDATRVALLTSLKAQATAAKVERKSLIQEPSK